MGRRRRSKRLGNLTGHGSGSGRNNRAVTSREEKTGKRNSVKAMDMFKIEHLESIAVWASRDAKIPALAALYGRNLALTRESLDLPPNNALFQCQRCDTILWSGTNCTVRATKSKAKKAANYVLYTCNFCSHRNFEKDNARRRDAEEKESETCPSNSKTTMNAALDESDFQAAVGVEEEEEEDEVVDATRELGQPQIPVVSSEIPTTNASEPDSPNAFEAEKVVGGRVEAIAVLGSEQFYEGKDGASIRISYVTNELDKLEVAQELVVSAKIDCTDAAAVQSSRLRLTKLVDTNKRKRKKPTAKKSTGPENSPALADEENTIGKSTKRKRKSWTGLKEIAEKQNFYNLTIPFSL